MRPNYHLETYSASEFATNESDGKLALKSFYPYPYDYVPEEALALRGKLDHILVHVFMTESCKVIDRNIEGRNWKPSDHMPIVAELAC